MNHKAKLVLLGQTPPPWHGQAAATQILFEHDWTDFEVERIRMDFSDEIHEIGRFKLIKLKRLLALIFKTREALANHPYSILFYPPGSANWIPFLRDVIFLSCVREKAAKTVFIYHASGLASFTQRSKLSRWLGNLAYGGADLALEVAEEEIAPHVVFDAKRHQWCPCGIAVPDIQRQARAVNGALRILFVGSLQEGKGVLQILRTAAVLKKGGEGMKFEFKIVGKWFSSEFEEAALKLLSELGLEEMVTFTGELTGEAKWHAYASTDVFFFPTHYQSEATPIVLMEALGMGCAILTTEWAGIPAMLNGCRSARLFPTNATQLYSEALITFYHEFEKGIDHSNEAKKFYCEHFLPKIFVERVEHALQDVL